MKHNSWAAVFESILQTLCDKALCVYGDRLVSVAVFGSVGRAAMRPDSDIDMHFVLERLSNGRLKRMAEFQVLDRLMDPVLREARVQGVSTSLSPVLKTPEEVRLGSPLFLDMVEDARILVDRNGFFRQQIDLLRERLAQLGAKRVWKGNAWYWDLKPDYRCGEEFEL